MSRRRKREREATPVLLGRSHHQKEAVSRKAAPCSIRMRTAIVAIRMLKDKCYQHLSHLPHVADSDCKKNSKCDVILCGYKEWISQCASYFFHFLPLFDHRWRPETVEVNSLLSSSWLGRMSTVNDLPPWSRQTLHPSSGNQAA